MLGPGGYLHVKRVVWCDDGEGQKQRFPRISRQVCGLADDSKREWSTSEWKRSEIQQLSSGRGSCDSGLISQCHFSAIGVIWHEFIHCPHGFDFLLLLFFWTLKEAVLILVCICKMGRPTRLCLKMCFKICIYIYIYVERYWIFELVKNGIEEEEE